MRNRRGMTEFIGLLAFLVGVTLMVTNGFSGRIFAQEREESAFEKIEPIGEVLAEVMRLYVREPDMDKAVEGALSGIMNSLDRNSSFIPPSHFQTMQEETEGEFDGIGVHIKDDEGRITVFQPIPGAPASRAGIRAGDVIWKIDGVSTEEMDLSEAARRIKGPRGQVVHLTILRKQAGESEEANEAEWEPIEFDVKRGKIPLESILEARLIDNSIGYIRVSDFKKHTSDEIKDRVKEFSDQGMKSLILDLRWNPGGLLSAARDVTDLFLPKNSLVTSTRGRELEDGSYLDEMKLYTEDRPVIPQTMPLIILTSRTSASSSEIVTGALQYHQRAIVVGEKTFGKGSVQTIIPLRRPEGSALRLTTALYYTPGNVTIDKVGILPDVEVEMDFETQQRLQLQMIASYSDDASLRNEQNHGEVTGDEKGEDGEELVEDTVLRRAVEILKEDSNFSNLLAKYHKDVSETQVAAQKEAKKEGEESEDKAEAFH